MHEISASWRVDETIEIYIEFDIHEGETINITIAQVKDMHWHPNRLEIIVFKSITITKIETMAF